jgi:prepilin-type N-terminal cleavage/methylation domain-containing protein
MKQKGFTLIELIVVIAVIGILAFTAVVSLSGIRERARDSRRMSDISAVQQAMGMIYSENSDYTKAGCSTGAALSACASSATGLLKTYLTTLANTKDQSGSTTLCSASLNPAQTCEYNFTALNKNDFKLYFYLENGAGNLGAGMHYLSEAGIQ